MSDNSIAEKSQIIRQETQQYANTKDRVADVLDDINVTKVSHDDLDNDLNTIDAQQEAQDALIEDLINKDATHDFEIADLQNNDVNLAAQFSDLNSKKLNKPLAPNNTPAFVMLGDGSTAPAEDLGKNIYNSNGALTANRTVNLASLFLNFTGGNIGINKPNPTEALDIVGRAKMDALLLNPITSAAIPYRFRSDGEYLYFTNGSSVEKRLMYKDFADYKSLWQNLTDAEKNEIKTIANGGWTTNTMSVMMVTPVIVRKDNSLQYISLLGANLNFNPVNFSVQIVDVTGATVIATIPNSQVQLQTNGLSLIFYYNFDLVPIGTYKIRLNNGIATYTTSVTFSVIDVSSLDYIDKSLITWDIKVVNDLNYTDYIIAGSSVDLSNNVKNLDNSPYTSANNSVLVSAVSSSLKTITGLDLTMNDNFYLEFETNRNETTAGFLSGITTENLPSVLINQICGQGFRYAYGYYSYPNDQAFGGWVSLDLTKITINKQNNIISLVINNSKGTVVGNITTFDIGKVRLKHTRISFGNISTARASFNFITGFKY